MFGENEQREERCLRVTMTVRKHDDQKQVGEKQFGLQSWPMLLLYSPSLKEVSNERVQEAGGRNWCRGLGGVLLTSLFHMNCSACFLTEPRTT